MGLQTLPTKRFSVSWCSQSAPVAFLLIVAFSSPRPPWPILASGTESEFGGLGWQARFAKNVSGSVREGQMHPQTLAGKRFQAVGRFLQNFIHQK